MSCLRSDSCHTELMEREITDRELRDYSRRIIRAFDRIAR